MSNGQPLIVRAALKPISTLTKPLRSVDTETKEPARGAARAHRLDRGAGGRRGRRGDGRAGPGALLPGEVRRRPHRRRARRAGRLPGAHRVAAVEGQARRRPAARRPAIVFIGFMGAGKTHGRERRARRRAGGDRGRRAARGRARDADRRVLRASRRGRSSAPRGAPRSGQLLEDADGGAIALGGGAVCSERVRAALGRHVVVWLQVSAEEAWRRVEGSDRPLAQDRDELRGAARRAPAASTRSSPTRSCRRATRAGRAGAARAARPARAAARDADGLGGERVGRVPGRSSARACSAAGWWPLEGRRFCVTDTTVGRPLRRAGRAARGPGRGRARASRRRRSREAERVLRELARLGMSRADHLVALGGGVVGDLAGFCAATYQRGVDGGAGADHAASPRSTPPTAARPGSTCPRPRTTSAPTTCRAAVIADTATLATLPAEELAAGFVEVVKTGAARRRTALGARCGRSSGSTRAALGDVIFACARTKLEVVAADERDSGRRAVLNLGHTVGHAIEAASGYERYRHGEAVGLGLLAALRLSGRRRAPRRGPRRSWTATACPTALDPGDRGRGRPRRRSERDKKRDRRRRRLRAPGAPRRAARSASSSTRTRSARPWRS